MMSRDVKCRGVMPFYMIRLSFLLFVCSLVCLFAHMYVFCENVVAVTCTVMHELRYLL